MGKSTSQPTGTGKVTANDELSKFCDSAHHPQVKSAYHSIDAVMEMLASLHMAAETAKRLIDFIITSAEEHLHVAANTIGIISLESLASDLPNLEGDTNLDSSTLSLSPTSSEASLPLPDESSLPVILSLQSAESSFTPSVQASSAAPSGAAADVTISLVSTMTPNESDTPVVPATPPVATVTPVPSFNPTGPAHLLGTPGMHLQSYNGFVYEVPVPDANGPFYLVTRGLRVGIFSGWYVRPLMSSLPC